jgi:hypothetical protein
LLCAQVRDAAPNAQIIWLAGNHEERIPNYLLDNAAAAFGRNISFFNRDNALAQIPANGDRWDAIFNNINSVATEVCRSKMSPARMF